MANRTLNGQTNSQLIFKKERGVDLATPLERKMGLLKNKHSTGIRREGGKWYTHEKLWTGSYKVWNDLEAGEGTGKE